MNLTIYTPTTPTDLSQVNIVSVTDRTQITVPFQLVVGNQEDFTLAFADQDGNTPAWAADAAQTVEMGIGITDASGNQLFAALASLTVAGSTRIGTLDLNTALLRDAVYRFQLQRCSVPAGAWLTLELRRTDASGNRVTFGLIPVFVLWRVLSTNPTIPPSDPDFLTAEQIAALYLAKADGIYLVPMMFFGSAIDEQVFGYFYAERGAKILGMQIAAQTAPVGSALTVDLVDSVGAEQSKIATLAIAAKQQRTVFSSPLTVAIGTEWRGKIKSVGSSTPGGYLLVNLIVQPNP